MFLLAALLPFVAIAPDHWTFELRGGLDDVRPGNRTLHVVKYSPFVPWGFNYDRTRSQGKDLIWEEAPFAKVEHDFRAARKLGANAIRLFLQMSRFMPRYLEIDPAALDQLDRVIQLARRYDLRLDLTGLSHITGAPDWFGARTSQEIQRAELLFWETLARRYAGEGAIFAFDLQNEPLVTGADHDLKPAGCFTMTENRQFCYVNIHRVLPGMSRQETARQWTAAMVETIHKQDPRRLVTIGLVPIAAPVMGEFNPGFDLPTTGPLVDYISLHFYPNRPGEDFLNLNQDRLEMLLRYAGGFGKPVVLEEWYPLYPKGAQAREGDWFPHVMQASLANAAGWFTFFFDMLYERPDDQVILSRHVSQFQESADRMRSATLQRAPATTTLKIDPDLLWRSKDEAQRVLNEYQRLRRAGQVPDFR